MMAKAVANATTASFIRMVGSEFVQKYLGEGEYSVLFFSVLVSSNVCIFPGPRMVRDVFRLARENSPVWHHSIIIFGCSKDHFMNV
jgi:26S proteasome regulatory subunit T3